MRAAVRARFVEIDGEKRFIRGVTYGAFSDGADGFQSTGHRDHRPGLRADGRSGVQHRPHLHDAPRSLLDRAPRALSG